MIICDLVLTLTPYYMPKKITTESFKKATFFSKILFFTGLLITTLSHSQSFTEQNLASKEVAHSFYLVGNTGTAKPANSKSIFEAINLSSKEDKDATLILLGNFTKEGYPLDKSLQKDIEKQLKKDLLEPTEGFIGNIILTPGFNEWREDGGHKNLDDMESFLQDNSKAKFWPNDGCAIEGESIGEQVELIIIDSQWFLEDWDEHPYINNKCDIKTRKQFFIEFKDELKDNQGKTIIVAIHHPVLSNTKQGFFEKTGGFNKQAYYNLEHQELRNRLETIASQFEDVIFISGSDKNLQFLEDDGIPQIISGAAAKTKAAKTHDKGHFASSKNGYAKLTVFKDGSSLVNMFEVSNSGSKQIFETYIKRERIGLDDVTYKSKEDYGETFTTSVYTKEETDKTGFYKFLWGDHYREVYSKEVEVPVLFLDELKGNPKAISEGGGHQSRSLRLKNDLEHEYTLREVRKSALRFLQHSINNHYVIDYMQNTIAEDVVQDYYTTAHPYAPFAVNDLSKAVDIYHPNPKLYYVPKQKSLGIYNEDYGDKLYMLEEHVGDENKEFETFGSPDDILSTSNLMEELLEDKKSYVDENEYIKARIFDMLIGDWDRHEDQWRWAEFKEDDGYKRYVPIPRDRDQAFSKYDGPIVTLLKLGMPEVRAMQTFQEELKDVKWFNTAAYPLDKTFIKTAKWEDWKQQVEYIQQNLTDEKIAVAFAALPEDTKDASIAQIQKSLKARRDNLLPIAKAYFDYLNEFEVITGTEKDDFFNIQRKEKGITSIEIIRKDKTIFKNDYRAAETKEIWIYGLDGNDEFLIDGSGDHLIPLRIMGGEENDIYDFKNKRKAKLYDYRSKKNTIRNPGTRKWLVDSYDINNYNVGKRKKFKNIFFPSIGFDPDAGLNVGFSDTYTTYGLANNPFATQHTFSAQYFFATSGYEVNYSGEFAHIFHKWNFGLDAMYTSPNYTMNYFGTGNETSYNDDAVDLDYNRVRIHQWGVAPSLIYRNDTGITFSVKAGVESLEVEGNNNEFISTVFDASNNIYENQIYGDAQFNFQFKNKPNMLAYPSRGLQLDLIGGYKTNIDEYENKFAYLKPMVSVNYPLHESGIAVIATKIGGDFIFGDEYEFYHAATLGGKHSLRGYRNERFNGRSAVYQSTDLRVGLSKLRTNFIPLRMGVSAGFDYGRVWTDDNNSDKWHNDYGGSIWINGFQALTANFGYYIGEDSNRFMFNLGFTF